MAVEQNGHVSNGGVSNDDVGNGHAARGGLRRAGRRAASPAAVCSLPCCKPLQGRRLSACLGRATCAYVHMHSVLSPLVLVAVRDIGWNRVVNGT